MKYKAIKVKGLRHWLWFATDKTTERGGNIKQTKRAETQDMTDTNTNTTAAGTPGSLMASRSPKT